jgi:hypothetical protein
MSTIIHNIAFSNLDKDASFTGAWDWSKKQVFKVSVSGSLTITISNSSPGATAILIITPSGNGTITWSAPGLTLKWPTYPGEHTELVSGQTDILTFIATDTDIFGTAQTGFS